MFAKRLRFLAAAGLLLWAVGGLSACAGYRFGAVKPEKLAHIHTIAVPTFKNMTLEPRSSVLITNEIIGRLQLDGTYKVASTKTADAILKGTLQEIRRRPLRTARFNTIRTREMQFEVLIEYTLEDPHTQTVLTRGRARGSSHIFLEDNFQLTERQSLAEAAANAARYLVSQLAEGLPGLEPANEADANASRLLDRSASPGL